MSALDRAVLYVGVVVAIVVAAVSLRNVHELDSRLGNVPRDLNRVESELTRLEPNGPPPIEIKVHPLPADQCAAADGGCCTQSGPYQKDPNGNPYVRYGDTVKWVFESPGVHVEFSPGADTCPFPKDCNYSDDGSAVTSSQTVQNAAHTYTWAYKQPGGLTWEKGTSSCKHVVNDHSKLSPPGIVMQ